MSKDVFIYRIDSLKAGVQGVMQEGNNMFAVTFETVVPKAIKDANFFGWQPGLHFIFLGMDRVMEYSGNVHDGMGFRCEA